MTNNDAEAAWFGQVLFQARTARKLTRSQLAEAIGKGSSTIRNYERGASMPDPATICTLGKILKLTGDEIARAQEASRRRRAHHDFIGCPRSEPSDEPPPAKPARRARSCVLSSTEQIAAIAWEARRLGLSFDAVRLQVDAQGGGDIFRRFLGWKRAQRASVRKKWKKKK